MLQLIISAASPFARKVRVLIREAGKTDLIKELSVNTTPLATDPQILPANPLGKIPALFRDDGPPMHDSRLICRYLDDLWQLGFYPKDKLWEVLTLEATADAMSEAAVLMVYEGRFRTDVQQSQQWVDAQWSRIARSLDVLEKDWLPLLHGPLHMGQVALACTLSYLDLRHSNRAWRAGHPHLAAWHAEFGDRPAMVATHPH